MAKRLDSPYLPGKRVGMFKLRQRRTLDCVITGYRPGKDIYLGLDVASSELWQGETYRLEGRSRTAADMIASTLAAAVRDRDRAHWATTGGSTSRSMAMLSAIAQTLKRSWGATAIPDFGSPIATKKIAARTAAVHAQADRLLQGKTQGFVLGPFVDVAGGDGVGQAAAVDGHCRTPSSVNTRAAPIRTPI